MNNEQRIINIHIIRDIYIYVYIYIYIYIYMWPSIASMLSQSYCGDEEDRHIGLPS